MSSQRGNANRTRTQKHNNVIAFKNNKHGDTPRTKMLNNLQISNICSHCKDVLEWKIKYNKYKTLTVPARCTKCLQKTVKQAYNIICVPCAEKLEVCAKCGEKKEIVAKMQPTDAEKAQMDAIFQQELKNLPERKRRTFLRNLEKLKNTPVSAEEEESNLKERKNTKDWKVEAEMHLQMLKLCVEKERKSAFEDEDDEDFDSDEFGDDLSESD